MKRLHVTLSTPPSSIGSSHTPVNAKAQTVHVTETKSKRRNRRTSSRQTSESEAVHIALSVGELCRIWMVTKGIFA